MSRYAPGDRVAALTDTVWDTDLPEPPTDYLRLYGHHGKVVPDCGKSDCWWNWEEGVHVVWTGTHDGRTGNTFWLDGIEHHMAFDEIEHVD